MEGKNFVICSKLEGSTNWTDWKLEMNSLFVLNDCAGIVDGTLEEPKQPDNDANEKTVRDYNQSMKSYAKANAKAAVIIRTNVSASVLNLIRMHGNDAKAIWFELLSNFEKVSGVKLDTLLQDFFTFRIEKHEDVMQSLARLRTLWVNLQREQELSGEGKLPQNLLAPRILSILPDEEYREFKSHWDLMPRDEKTPEKLIEQVNMRLQRRNQEHQEDFATTALLANSTDRRSKSNWKKTENFKTTMWTDPQRQSRPNYGSKGFYGNCFRCNKPGHMGKFCPDFPDKPFKAEDKIESFVTSTQTYAFTCLNDKGRDVWIKDDGATAHITNSVKYFKTYHQFDEPEEIVVGNMQKIPAYGFGDIDFRATVGDKQRYIILKDVLYAPDIGMNLLSTSRAMLRGISHVGNAEDMCSRFFRMESPDDILLEAKSSSSGLFILQATPIKPKKGPAASAYLVNHETTTPVLDGATTTTKLPLSQSPGTTPSARPARFPRRFLDLKDSDEQEASGFNTCEDECQQVTTPELPDRTTVRRHPTNDNSTIANLSEPETHQDVAKSPKCDELNQAMDDEIASHAKHKVEDQLAVKKDDTLDDKKNSEERKKSISKHTNWCTVCEYKFKGNYLAHRRTNEHRKKRNKKYPNCRFCRMGFSNSEEYRDHYKSEDHKQRSAELIYLNNTPLPEDSGSDEDAAKDHNPVFHARTGHFGQRYRLVQDEFSKGLFDLGDARGDGRRVFQPGRFQLPGLALERIYSV